MVVNLHLETDAETEFVSFDGERIRLILKRIAADLEELLRTTLSGEVIGPSPSRAGKGKGDEDPYVRHRRRLAEPIEEAEVGRRRGSPREERAALRTELGLPPQ